MSRRRVKLASCWGRQWARGGSPKVMRSGAWRAQRRWSSASWRSPLVDALTVLTRWPGSRRQWAVADPQLGQPVHPRTAAERSMHRLDRLEGARPPQDKGHHNDCQRDDGDEDWSWSHVVL